MTVSGRVAFSSTVEDGAGIPRLCVTHLTWEYRPVCGALGRAPSPGGRGYRCSLDAHDGDTHEAWVDGRRVDSWIGTA